MSDRIRTTDAEVDQFVDAVERSTSDPLTKIVELLIQRNRAISEVKQRVLARADQAVDAHQRLVESTAVLD